ncbi:hypothetical protein BST61_g1948 [Cercospora zeina]
MAGQIPRDNVDVNDCATPASILHVHSPAPFHRSRDNDDSSASFALCRSRADTDFLRFPSTCHPGLPPRPATFATLSMIGHVSVQGYHVSETTDLMDALSQPVHDSLHCLLIARTTRARYKRRGYLKTKSLRRQSSHPPDGHVSSSRTQDHAFGPEGCKDDGTSPAAWVA